MGNSFMRRLRQGIDCSRPCIEGEENAAIKWIEGHSAIILAALVCASLVINLAIIADRGVFFCGDSPRYVDGADRVFHHAAFVDNRASTRY